MPAVLLVLFLVVPLVELYVIIKVGSLVGVLPTIGLLLAASIAAAWLVRREGVRTWTAFRKAVDEGRVPAKETADGILVILGGALLLTPGFVTDVFGICCVLPPTRAMIRGAAMGLVTARFAPLRWLAFGRTTAGRVGKVQRYAAKRGPGAGPASGRRPANEPPRPTLPPE
jgi:UPF0716 protein FxsA